MGGKAIALAGLYSGTKLPLVRLARPFRPGHHRGSTAARLLQHRSSRRLQVLTTARPRLLVAAALAACSAPSLRCVHRWGPAGTATVAGGFPPPRRCREPTVSSQSFLLLLAGGEAGIATRCRCCTVSPLRLPVGPRGNRHRGERLPSPTALPRAHCQQPELPLAAGKGRSMHRSSTGTRKARPRTLVSTRAPAQRAVARRTGAQDLLLGPQPRRRPASADRRHPWGQQQRIAAAAAGRHPCKSGCRQPVHKARVSRKLPLC